MTKERRSTFGPEPTDDDGPDASDFQPRPIVRPDRAATTRAAEADGFISRPAAPAADTQRRHRTGRTAQLNLKVTPENKARFAEMADEAGVSLNVLFEHAIQAFEEKIRTAGR